MVQNLYHKYKKNLISKGLSQVLKSLIMKDFAVYDDFGFIFNKNAIFRKMIVDLF